MSSTVIEREDGTLVLPTRGDPARERVEGYRRYWVGVDLGQSDPTAIAIIRDERMPRWNEFNRQELGERHRAVVYADAIRDTSYSAIADHVRVLMQRAPIAGRVRLAIDASGVGRAFSDFLIEKKLEHMAVTITSGASTSRHGRHHNVAKNLLLGDLANALETGKLVLAHDLPLRDRIARELEAFEVKTTAAGNTVLDATARDHHSDIAIATAIALFASNNAPRPVEVGRVVGMY